MKTLSDTPKTFTFTATLPNFEQAQRAGSTLIGYMIGTYEQSNIDVTYIGNGSLKAEYISDEDLTENFERITNSLDHTDDYEDDEDYEEPKPKGKKKPVVDDDDEDDGDYEDEKPKGKKKSEKAQAKPKRRTVIDEDDDDDY